MVLILKAWRAAEFWHCARPGETTGKGTDIVVIKAPGLKES